MSQTNFLGVYSTKRTSKSSIAKAYWFVWFNEENNTYIAQKLSFALQPVSDPKIISNENFGLNFYAEEDITVIPEGPPDTKTFPTSSPKKNNEILSPNNTRLNPQDSIALELDTKMRSEFESSMSRWNRGYRVTAMKQLALLAGAKEGIIPAHKHSFRDFSSLLRMEAQYELALRFSLRVIALSPDDSHAYFNTARLYFEMKDYEKARMYLEDALHKEPTLTCAKNLLIMTKQKIKSTQERWVL